MNHIPQELQDLVKTWPSTLVSRDQVGTFTGGVISPKSMANYDSLGKGPANPIRVGRRVAYSVDSLIAWLASRATPARPVA